MSTEPTDPVFSKLILQGIHIDLTPAMQDIIRDKVAPLLRHNEYIVRIDLRLHQDQRLGKARHYTATAQIEIGGPDLVASAESMDAYEAIDLLVEKLDRQLEKRHERRKDNRNHPRAPEIAAELPKVRK